MDKDNKLRDVLVSTHWNSLGGLRSYPHLESFAGEDEEPGHPTKKYEENNEPSTWKLLSRRIAMINARQLRLC
ncbi:hypothetical protein KQX54_021677 [Cotesia glomerata]|uniref:Uncharacterized protein n=1 Tax=Cotesia glomerata TaxID=32391 RepID=A0AAV7J9W7_COTGL|nr:hypothetical protein KQX54_021677 [Cotesia glomerata]